MEFKIKIHSDWYLQHPNKYSSSRRIHLSKK